MESERVPLFALLIGINEYKSVNTFPLTGSVPDALSFQSYLQKCLGIPSNQINLLINEEATRSNIIGALKGFKEDKRIDIGDAIFVFYAGHGTEINQGWTRQPTQAIVPYDCDSPAEITPIPAHELQSLFAEIANEKGDNITVIYDCSYPPSSVTATDEVVAPRPRKDKKWPHLRINSTQKPLTIESASQSQGNLRGLGSHVQLSACKSSELAKESNGHGLFSTAILTLLNQVPPHSLRYSEILRHEEFRKIKGQTPQCEGLNQHRLLFNGKVLPFRRKRFTISFDKAGNDGRGQYTVYGGTIHGIDSGSEFGVYEQADIIFSKQISILQVDQLWAYWFTAKFPPNAPQFDLTRPMIAVQTKFSM